MWLDKKSFKSPFDSDIIEQAHEMVQNQNSEAVLLWKSGKRIVSKKQATSAEIKVGDWTVLQFGQHSGWVSFAPSNPLFASNNTPSMLNAIIQALDLHPQERNLGWGILFCLLFCSLVALWLIH